MNIRSIGKLQRREFLAASAATVVSAGALGKVGAAAAATDAEWRNRQPGMTYRRLGRTGFMVSSMVLGGEGIAPDNYDFALWAVDQGVNLFDVAPFYGNGRSEPGWGAVFKARGRDKVFMIDAVSGFGSRSRAYQDMMQSLPDPEMRQIRNRVAEEIERRGLDKADYMGPYYAGQEQALRNAMVINALAEKYGEKIDGQREYKQSMLDSVERSLKALGTDHLDCVLIHGVDTPYEIRNTPEVFEGFEILKKQGKARFLAFSAHTDPAGVLEAAMETEPYSMGLVAYHFLNHKYMAAVLEKAKKADFGVMCMKAARVLQNRFNRRQTQPERVKALDALVPGDMNVFQKGFRFALQNPNLSCVVAGIDDMAQAKQDVPLAMTKA